MFSFCAENSATGCRGRFRARPVRALLRRLSQSVTTFKMGNYLFQFVDEFRERIVMLHSIALTVSPSKIHDFSFPAFGFRLDVIEFYLATIIKWRPAKVACIVWQTAKIAYGKP
jgi:hypothetical protein